MRPKSIARRLPPTRIVASLGDINTTAQDHYRLEKARRVTRKNPGDELMAAAKREYLAILETATVKGKGGRPKKKPGQVAADTLSETDVDQADDE